MEHQDAFNSYPNKLARTSSALIIHPRNESTGAAATPVSTFINTPINNDGINNPNIQTNPNERQQVPEQSQCVVREQDQYMPIANVIRIMRRILPPHAKISDDAKETVQECVSEYISFITGEANERCHREQRKTITAEDVIWAMGKLGFDNYVEPLTLFLNRYRESESERTSMPKEPMVRRSAVDYGQIGMPGPGQYGPVYNLGPQQGFYDPSLGAFFRDGPGSGLGGGSSSQPQGGSMPGPGFDPFAQFK